MIPGLDGLRAIAVLLVLLFHQQVLDCGWIGVQLFFVLSGFLITRILVKSRNLKLGSYLKTFYGRRFLRIFPAYYVYLFALMAATAIGVAKPPHGGLIAAFTYTSDFYQSSTTFQHSEYLSHFWSLSVEEQFYLVWPFFIFFLPSRLLKPALGAIVLAGPIVRLVTWFALRRIGIEDEGRALYGLPWSHLDAFAIGAMVSLFPVEHPRRGLAISAAVLAAAGAALLFSYAKLRWHSFGFAMRINQGYGFVWGYSLIDVTSAFLIASVAQGFGRRFLENRFLRHAGKVSYGLYIFHFPIQAVVDRFIPHQPHVVRIAVQAVAALVVATASYRLLEGPLLSLKDRFFPAQGSARAEAPVAAPGPGSPAVG